MGGVGGRVRRGGEYGRGWGGPGWKEGKNEGGGSARMWGGGVRSVWGMAKMRSGF